MSKYSGKNSVFPYIDCNPLSGMWILSVYFEKDIWWGTFSGERLCQSF